MEIKKFPESGITIITAISEAHLLKILQILVFRAKPRLCNLKSLNKL